MAVGLHKRGEEDQSPALLVLCVGCALLATPLNMSIVPAPDARGTLQESLQISSFSQTHRNEFGVKVEVGVADRLIEHRAPLLP